PVEKFNWRPTRPPVIPELWDATCNPAAERFTTVCTWQNEGKDIQFRGQTYYWSKHINFLELLELPRRTPQPLELAVEGGDPATRQLLDPATRELLTRHGWILTDAFEASHSLTAYQQFIQRSRGEFTVSKDLVVRTRCGWFSDRSVCYLAAGKPVVTQDTGFGRVVPTGAGLFAFSTMEEAVAALEEINRDYPFHSRAARRIAEESFGADRVLARLCREADL
ncbi:MAG TPA: hypothetical protein VFT36_03260, partial [Methylomirabilota bacterium]|nr:hypothetical protein [Methylomirabilota bacterium]